jgi:4,5-DOPA dioxygenase extradiol
MKRREAIKAGSLVMGAISVGGLKGLYNEINSLRNNEKAPVLFIGHGSPMNAIEDNSYSKTWKELGDSLPVPAAVLSVSAHWLSHGVTKVTAMTKPETIHDFGGFPKSLFDIQYPAPGAPEFAVQTIQLLHDSHVEADHGWGLDHGTWSVLVKMFPKANIPVYQLSIDYSKPPEYHFNLMKDLQVLRDKGVLLMGSGNIVHNLSRLQMNSQPYDWSIEFDALIKSYIDKGDYLSVVNFQKSGNLTKLAHPTYDHFLPLLYSLGMADIKDRVSYFNEGIDLGSISMRSLLISKV